MSMDAFTPIQINKTKIKNRFVRSATNTAMGNRNGSISDLEMCMYDELSKNHIGLIITGHCYVNKQGQTKAEQTSVCDEAHLSRFKSLTSLVHENGSKIFVQLSHGGANVVVPEYPVAPSESETPTGNIARQLTVKEVHGIIDDFINAASLAQRADFDGVQIHIAHGFLLCQFVSYGSNRRKDQYGGPAENRIRIIEAIVRGIREKCGDEFPIIAKINSNCSIYNSQYKDDVNIFFEKLIESGIDAIELSGFDFTRRNSREHLYYLQDAVRLRTKYDIPLILVGGVRTKEDIEVALNAGIDMISLCRPLIAEPDFISRLMKGQFSSKCISCNQCFGLYLREQRRCILND